MRKRKNKHKTKPYPITKRTTTNIYINKRETELEEREQSGFEPKTIMNENGELVVNPKYKEHKIQLPVSFIDKKTTTNSYNKYIKKKKIIGPKCPKCNCNTVKRSGEYGEFWGCCRYPSCKYSLPIRKTTEDFWDGVD